MFKNIFALLLFLFVAESTKDTYEYVRSVKRYMKMHRIPANWREARLRCELEDGVLASPESKEMLDAMFKIMNDRGVNKIYTGIHATFSKGDFTTISGTPLSELDVEWMQGEPDNLNNDEDCLVMHSSGALADVKCTNNYPFICHKSPEKMKAHSCSLSTNGIIRSDYVLYSNTGSCYKFHKEGRFWPDAFRTCQAEDAYLAIINSEDESQFLKDLFAQHQPKDIPGDFFKESASIGFRRSDNDQESFVTIQGQSLTEAGFTAFNAGEPNNGGKNESCGSVWRNGLLNDHNCHERVAFICEKSLPNAHSCSYPQDENSDYALLNKTTSCYKFHKEALFWPDALKACQAEGAYLAIINSEMESQVLKELFAQNPAHDIPGDGFKDSASIGFRRSDNNKELFVTINGRPLNTTGFTTFNYGEPNNAGNNESCGSVWRNGLLNDHNCYEPIAFICEKPLVPKFELRFDSNNY